MQLVAHGCISVIEISVVYAAPVVVPAAVGQVVVVVTVVFVVVAV